MWILSVVISVVLAESVLSQQCAQIGEYCQLSSQCCSGACLSFAYKCVTLQTPPVYQPESVISSADDLVNRFGGASSVGGTNNVATAANGINNRVTLTESVPSNQCAQIGEYCQVSSQCCAGSSCLSFAYKCVKLQTSPVYQPEFVVSSVDDLVNRFGGASSFGGSNDAVPAANGINNRFGGGDATVQPAPVTPAPTRPTVAAGSSTTSSSGVGSGSCLRAGSQCINSMDCCSGYCSRYGNSCVTPAMFLSPCKKVGGKCYSNLDCCSGRCMVYLHQCVSN